MGAAPVLTFLKNGEEIKSHALEGEAMLGRSEGCVIRLEDRAISRQHAVFRRLSDGVQVEKKSEFAPVTVNGAECTSAVLKEGDVISIGPYLVKLSIPSSKDYPRLEEPRGGEQTIAPEPQSASNSTQDASSSTAPSDTLLLPDLEQVGSAKLDGDGNLSANPPIDSSINSGEPNLGELKIESEPAVELPGFSLQPIDENQQIELAQQNALPTTKSMEAISAQPAGEMPASNEFALDGIEKLEVAGPVEEVVSDDAKTKVAPQGKVSIHLHFKPGAANIEDYEVNKDEISIGRGQSCDIVLNDKKASRKNAVIVRKGMSFVIRDLQSANGTYVNGVKIEEQELSGDDAIKIGNTEFQFKALSSDYLERQKDFMEVKPEPEAPEPSGFIPDMNIALPSLQTTDEAMAMVNGTQSGADSQSAMAGSSGMTGSYQSPSQAIPALGMGAGQGAGMTGVFNLPGGIPGVSTGGRKESLTDKFKSWPMPRKLLFVALLAAAIYLGIFDEDEAPPPPKQKVVKKDEKGAANYESLTPEQKRFVETQHNLAFDLYTAGDYDKAIFEVRKIFALLPDYKQAREIERYSLEGKRKLEAKAEEQKKREAEAALRAKVALLIEETRERMDKKQFEEAKELFSQIVTLDPDNPVVAEWKKQIEEWEEQKRLEDQNKRVQRDINERAWEVYKEGVALKKKGKYHAAIESFQKVIDIGASDKRTLTMSHAMIKKCKAIIAAKRDPVLASAKQAEDGGEFAKAFKLYKEASIIDPPHPAAYAGMNRIRVILHDRAKVVYTEAVLAESYSDFATAKKKFKECLQTAPQDDIYHERAQRKLAHYFERDDQGS